MKKNNQNLKVIIPARIGSNRVPIKNLRLLDKKPLIQHIIDSLKKTKYLNNFEINSDSDLFKNIALENNIDLYLRPKDLATSKSLIDEYIYEYIKSKNPEHLAVVNPTSPFISSNELDKAWLTYSESDCDTLLSCEKIQTHCFKSGKAINFSINGKHPRSQDIDPVYALNFAISIWNCKKFMKNYEDNGYGVYTGKIEFFITSEMASIDIDYPEDFRMAEYIAELKNRNQKAPKEEFPEYVNQFLKLNKNIQN